MRTERQGPVVDAPEDHNNTACPWHRVEDSMECTWGLGEQEEETRLVALALVEKLGLVLELMVLWEHFSRENRRA